MRRIALLAAGLSIMAQAALAADLRPPPPPPPVKALPPPVYLFTWTGCYVGGHGGGLWLTKDYALTSVVGIAVPTTTLGSHDASSWIAGLQAGCNYQFAGGFVIGIQGDYAWTDANGSHGDPAGVGTVLTSKTKSLGSVTGRLGYGWDRLLLYVKGGWAWEKDDYTWDFTAVAGVGAVLAASETRGGWTVGVGGEYAFLDWLTGFIEYNYYDFGTKNLAFTFAPVNVANIDITETKSVVKAGLNFKFGPSPVVARY
jgi:outer membrane immunogenic protein